MKSFDALVAEAEAADVSGWGFGWLAGRASEERPPWGYARLLAQRLAGVESALDVDTDGGEVLDETCRFPSRMYATEAWPSNVRKAHERLGTRGVLVVEVASGAALPFVDASFPLVTSPWLNWLDRQPSSASSNLNTRVSCNHLAWPWEAVLSFHPKTGQFTCYRTGRIMNF